ncbi:MAG: 4-hydroxy-3-methylbut-2-enyl diphosphate reductase [Christensenellales bacterium]|jgi:(E)-4-hydroxy-3-methyl-but-2-enyl pyrophosphate reductase
MKIIVADHAGFCFGVRNAIDMALHSRKDGGVSTLGELIHNSRAIGELERQGVYAKNEMGDIDTCQVVIRAHGASPEVFHSLTALGYKVIDATCPFVKRIQREADKRRGQGVPIIIIGNKSHPEVAATYGWAGEGAYIVDSLADVEKLPELDEACILGQTTYSVSKRDELLEAISKRIRAPIVFNFICATTGARQKEAEEISKKCDAVLVIGDEKSANTKNLVLVAKRHCENVTRIMSKEEIPLDKRDETGKKDEKDEKDKKDKKSKIRQDMTVGILAGASTPPEAIKEVVDFLENI